MKKEIMADDMGDMTLTTEMDYEYESLLQNVGNALSKGRQKVASYIGAQTVRTYWKIGKYIVEYEQNGKEKAEYGSNLLKRISRDLTDIYGSGFGMSNVNKMRKMYIEYPILQTVSAKLTWSHFVELLKIEDPLERSFYEKQAEIENWGVRELKRQRSSLLFQRLALSTDKNSVMKLAQKGQIIEKPEDILKEPFVFEFTGLPQQPLYKEGDLKSSLINNLSMFFLELGKGFTFVGNQYRINIAGRTYKIDLVLYNRILKCFVLIDLKRGEVQHEDIGQMNFYLNYCRDEMNIEGDTEPIGIVLGTDRDKLVMKYALQNITNQVFVSRYQLYLPDKDELEAEFRRFMGTDYGCEETEAEDDEMEKAKLSVLVIDCKQYIPVYNWYFRKSDGCIYGTANSPEDICYDETRLTIFESSDDFVLMPECPGMTDDEAAAVVKDWCLKNDIKYIDDMDDIEETRRAIYM